MAVITISRELGSDGASIGQHVAQILGYDFVDKDVIERVFRQYGMTKFEDIYSSAPGILHMFSYNSLLTIAMFNEMLEAIAQRGSVVIVGRGGFAVLGDYADVLDVRIEAPHDLRILRIMQREELSSVEQAAACIQEDDNIRSKFVQLFYNRRWDDPSSFDLLFDSSIVSGEDAAAQIVEAVKALEQNIAGKNLRTTASLEVDPVLADAVEQVMAYPRFSPTHAT